MQRWWNDSRASNRTSRLSITTLNIMLRLWQKWTQKNCLGCGFISSSYNTIHHPLSSVGEEIKRKVRGNSQEFYDKPHTHTLIPADRKWKGVRKTQQQSASNNDRFNCLLLCAAFIIWLPIKVPRPFEDSFCFCYLQAFSFSTLSHKNPKIWLWKNTILSWLSLAKINTITSPDNTHSMSHFYHLDSYVPTPILLAVYF